MALGATEATTSSIIEARATVRQAHRELAPTVLAVFDAQMTPKQFSRGLRAAVAKFKSVRAGEKTPRSYSVAQKTVVCSHCGSTRFLKSEASGMVCVGDMDAPTATLHALACEACSKVEFFGCEPLALGEEAES